MDLILVRHGRPERSEATSNPPLSLLGHDQAARVARWLAEETIDAVWSSTMRRAVQTAEPFANQAGHTVREHAGIVEFDQAAAPYIPTEELKRENFALWQAMATGAHGGVINMWASHVLCLAPRIFFEADYTRINRFVCARAGQSSVVSLNERAAFALSS